MHIILASGSPRRKELLGQAGFSFEIEVSNADENVDRETPEEMVMELAARKAAAVAALHEGAGEDCLVIGADTIVVRDGEVLGKPADEEDAEKMLASLSGRAHQVHTGVALLLVQDGKVVREKRFQECTDVAMRELAKEEIAAYVKSGEPMDKAGAYGIQGGAAVFISGIRGDYYNVVGLPVCRVYCEIREMIG